MNETKSTIPVRKLTQMALCVAFCCVSAYLSIPLPFTPVMVTLLTLALALTAFLLPPKETFLVITAYILLGAIGIPVFVGGTAGIGRILGPTGGYIWSWLLAYPIMSYLKGSKPSFLRYVLLAIFLATGINYLFGTIQLMLQLHLNLQESILMGVLPYIPGDILKSICAAFLSIRIQKR